MTERRFRVDAFEQGRSNRASFDPIAEGKRYGLTPEASAAIWQHARREVTNQYGVCDEALARERFTRLAKRVALGGVAAFQSTQSDVASNTSLNSNVLANPVPGRTTRVLARASDRTDIRFHRDPGRTTLNTGHAESDVEMPEDSRGFFRRSVTGARAARSKLANAIAARDHRAALAAVNALRQDLKSARHHFANGLAHDEGLRSELAALEEPTRQLLARVPNIDTDDRSWKHWAAGSDELHPAIAHELSAIGEHVAALDSQSPEPLSLSSEQPVDHDPAELPRSRQKPTEISEDHGKSTVGEPGESTEAANIHRVAQSGVSGSGGALPHLEQIQIAFGPEYDLSRIQAYVGGKATDASKTIDAEAYAMGHKVAFRTAPSLHTAAHEAAHVVQQAAGSHPARGVGQAGDEYERNADAVADSVVQGLPARHLLPNAAARRAIGHMPAARAVQLAPPNPGGGPSKSTFDPQVQAALAKQGTSPNVGKFEGLQGTSIEEVVSRVPADWKAKPTEQGLPGAHFSDPKNPGNAIRIHGPDPKAPAGTNSSSGWTLRVVKNGNYHDDHGKNLTKDLGGKAARQADVGHIPLAGNSRLAAPKPNLPAVPPLSGGPESPGLPQGSPPTAAPPTPKVNSSAEPPHPSKPVTTAETGSTAGAGRVKASGVSKITEGAAENTSTFNRLLRGFENGMKTFFSPKVQVPLAVALELLVFVDAMDMASGGLSGEGFILREEIKKSIQIESEAASFRNWYEGYHDDLASAVTQANILIMTKGSAEARGTMRQRAGEILGPLRARAGEVDTLLRKVSAIHREAEQKAGIAEKLLNSKEFAALTSPMGTVVLANVFAAMQDLTRISGYSASAESDLAKVKQLVQEDILIMELYR